MDWDSDTVVKANGLLKMYTTFQFIVVFVVTMNAMAVIKPVSVKLQKRSIDIVSAYNEVSSVINWNLYEQMTKCYTSGILRQKP